MTFHTRTLSTTIDFLHYQHDMDENAQSLKVRSSTSTQLHFQIVNDTHKCCILRVWLLAYNILAPFF